MSCSFFFNHTEKFLGNVKRILLDARIDFVNRKALNIVRVTVARKLKYIGKLIDKCWHFSLALDGKIIEVTVLWTPE